MVGAGLAGHSDSLVNPVTQRLERLVHLALLHERRRKVTRRCPRRRGAAQEHLQGLLIEDVDAVLLCELAGDEAEARDGDHHQAADAAVRALVLEGEQPVQARFRILGIIDDLDGRQQVGETIPPQHEVVERVIDTRPAAPGRIGTQLVPLRFQALNQPNNSPIRLFLGQQIRHS